MSMRNPVIRAENLHKSFGNVQALAGVDLHVAAGEIFGILGPNGAGKTTTVECLAGTIKPDAGALSVLGVDPALQREMIRRHVGYQLQATTLPAALKVGEAMRWFAALYPDPADPVELLELVGMSQRTKRRIGTLSGGERQRLSIATALVGRPRIAIFDELTTGLDPQARRGIWALVHSIRAGGVTVVLVSHALDEVERLCDRMAVIDQGRLRFAGTPAELRRQVLGQHRGGATLEDAYLRLLDAGAQNVMEGQ